MTVNANFADTDVDEQQFNLTPYRIFFPERRQLFLENSDMFEFRTWFRDLLYVIYNVGTRFSSLAAENPMQLREQKLAIKLTYSISL